jgi:hypothetical protein
MNAFFGHVGQKCPMRCVPDTLIAIRMPVSVNACCFAPYSIGHSVRFLRTRVRLDIIGHFPLSLFREGMSDVRFVANREKKTRHDGTQP